MNTKRSIVRIIYAFLLALTATVVSLHAQGTGSAASQKLTTVLADLAGSVAQDDGRVSAARAGTPAPLSVDALPKAVQDAVQSRRLRLNDRAEAQVYILLSSASDEHLAQLRSNGVTIEIADTPRRRVQARVPVSRLQAIAGLPFVDFIRLPTYARHNIGRVTTEGDGILHTDAARQQLSLDGTGVRVGVISDGIKGLFATSCTTCTGAANGPISSGDLPDASGVRDANGVLRSSSGGVLGRSFQGNGDLEGLPGGVCGFAGAGAEGTAILEIVHDLAPGSKLSFANFDTDLTFAQAVDYLASTNDVVIDDIGFFGVPFDGTSVVSSATAGALNNRDYPIRGYFTSVGNAADAHYYDLYNDSRVEASVTAGVVSTGSWHLFQQTADTTDVLGVGAQPYNLIALPRGGEVVVFLSWDDPYGASGNNYDLYLISEATGRVVARSTDAQRGAQDPVEFIDYVNNGTSGLFHLAVQNVGNAAQPRHLNIYSFEPQCAFDGPRPLASARYEQLNFNTPALSVTAQSDAGGSPVAAVSVGAICSASATAAARFSTLPNASCNDTSHSTMEFFSSRGPTLDGRQKPDVSAIDGVSVTGAGSFVTTFFGTSAAAPHVAGIAALALQAAPCLLATGRGALDPVDARTTLRDLIVRSAVPLSADGAPDNTSGAGRADAAATIQKTLPVFNGATTVTVDASSSGSATLTAEQLGFSSPQRCAVTTLSWTGGCGTGPGSTMTCPRGTTTVNVAASVNGLSFSAPIDLHIIVR